MPKTKTHKYPYMPLPLSLSHNSTYALGTARLGFGSTRLGSACLGTLIVYLRSQTNGAVNRLSSKRTRPELNHKESESERASVLYKESDSARLPQAEPSFLLLCFFCLLHFPPPFSPTPLALLCSRSFAFATTEISSRSRASVASVVSFSF